MRCAAQSTDGNGGFLIRIEVIAVGALKEAWMRDGCKEYSKRLGLWSKFTITEIEEFRLPKEPSPAQIAQGLAQEAQRILEKLPKGARVVALCIEGKHRSSEELSCYLEKAADSGGSVAFIIGGSHGLSEQVKQCADLRLSMSSMTFPHQLARVMLCEQIYRALSITAGTKYHK